MWTKIFWISYLILFLHSTECKEVIKTDGIPKHWKQYEHKLPEQNRNLNAAKPDYGYHQQSKLNIYKGVPLKINKIAQPAFNTNLNNALLLNNNNKDILQEHGNKVPQSTLNTNLNNVLHLLNNNKINLDRDNKVALQHNVSNTESSKVKVNLDVKDHEEKEHNDDDLNKDTPNIAENPDKDKSNASTKIVHHKENITESHLNNSSDLVSNSNKTVGPIKNKDFKTAQEIEYGEGFVDNEELMDKLRDIGNGSTEIDWVQEEPIQDIDNSPVPQLPKLVYPLSKIEDMNNIKLNPNYPQGWIRYRFIPNQYSLSDRGNYINKGNLYTKDWYPYTLGRIRRDLDFKRVWGMLGHKE